MSGSLEASQSVLTGRKLGHYQIESQIGRGGMGVVLRARDMRLGRRVAIKVLQRQGSQQAAVFERFIQEARLAAQLNHPHVVTIHEVNQDGAFVYIVMELLDGGSLQDRLQRQGKLAWRAALQSLHDVGCGLEAAHARGLIHRDIKPANILTDRSGQAKLGDFGLARRAVTGSVALTAQGSVIGTPLYMSPEQCEGQPADQRSDIYAMGATLHALLTGAPPYTGSEPLQVAFAHCSAPLPDPSACDPTIPASCTAVIQRAMAKKPVERYQTAAELLADLAGCSAAPAARAPLLAPPRRPPTLPIKPKQSRRHLLIGVGAAAGLLVVAVLCSALPVMSRSGPPRVAAVSAPDAADGPAARDPAARASAAADAVEHAAGSDAPPPVEPLDALFAQPTEAEARAVQDRWREISLPTEDWRGEGRRMGRMQIVSHRVDGQRQYAFLRYPEDVATQERFPVLIYCHSKQHDLTPRELRALRTRVTGFDKFLVVMPIFRGETMALGSWSQRRVVSAGAASDVTSEASDTLALLDSISRNVTQADPSRTIAVGAGLRGAVALQLGIRDRRIRAVVAAETPADAFHTSVRQAATRDSVSGSTQRGALASAVRTTVVQPVLEGKLELAAARDRLLALSPVRFIDALPSVQLYYGAFSTEFDPLQGQLFRQAHLQRGAPNRHFVCRHCPEGPFDPLTVRTLKRNTARLVTELVGGGLAERGASSFVD